jgi:hypothetical protein
MDFQFPVEFSKLPLQQWSSRNIGEMYHKICEIGHGTYGCVYKAESLDGKKTIVAIK